MAILSSDWGMDSAGLSEKLIAKFFPVEPVGTAGEWQRDLIKDTDEVWSAISDSNLETALQWNSPFEAIGAESKLPLLSGLLQSGALESTLAGLAAFAGTDVNKITNGLDFDTALKNLRGATGITQLNSTQIFSGMQPMKFTMTAHFRAWRDAAAEVTAPINQLMQWALPQELSKQGFIQNAQAGGLIRALFPSRAPRILGFSYGGMTVKPVVIESISQPITAPRDTSGARINVSLQLSVSTLAAIDRNDWDAYKVR